MVHVKKEGVLLEKTNNGFENEGVLNPATILEGENVHMFYRAVSKGNYSSIGYCKLNGPMEVQERHDIPLLFSQSENESHGIEDPRIVKIEDDYYLTYTAYDGVNALGALAMSKDLKQWTRIGLIVPQFTFRDFAHLAGSKSVINEQYLRYNEHEQMHEKLGKKVLVLDKNVIFFPRRINGKLHFLHRIRPDIQIVAVNDITELTPEFLQQYFLHLDEAILLCPKYDHEVSYIGGGCPPVETADGWLIIYHGVHDSLHGYIYSACAALLDLDDPHVEIARLPYPLFKPAMEWELKGEVNNVCFPTGTALFDDTLYIYYGAADERIACASVSLTALIQELKTFTKEKQPCVTI